jgi:hypothetical protein
VFVLELRNKHPRQQGDIGESVALNWLMQAGYGAWLPFGHSPDCDLIAQTKDGLLRVQVKTSTLFRKERWVVAICTRGGNRSWNGIVKRFDQSRYDHLFVVVADWRCWFIPAEEIEARSAICLGGPKYSQFEVSPPQPLRADEPPQLQISGGDRIRTCVGRANAFTAHLL